MARGRGGFGPPRSARPVKLSFSEHTPGRASKPNNQRRTFGEKPSSGEKYASRAEEPPYGPEWKFTCDLVKRRDNYTCQNSKCRVVYRPPYHGKLDCHHIIRREKGGPDTPDNLKTLCKPCHALEHKHLQKIGYGKSKRKRA